MRLILLYLTLGNKRLMITYCDSFIARAQ